MVIFPLAPDQTIAQMWSNGARGGRIWRPTWTSTEMSLRQLWPSCKGICGISRRSLSPSCSLIPGHGGGEEANYHLTSHQSRRWISSEVPHTTQPSHLWTTTARHGINQHTLLLPEAGLARQLPWRWSRDLAWAGGLWFSSSLHAGDSGHQWSCGARSCSHPGVQLK